MHSYKISFLITKLPTRYFVDACHSLMTVERGSITSHVTVPSVIESPTSAEYKFTKLT